MHPTLASRSKLQRKLCSCRSRFVSCAQILLEGQRGRSPCAANGSHCPHVQPLARPPMSGPHPPLFWSPRNSSLTSSVPSFCSLYLERDLSHPAEAILITVMVQSSVALTRCTIVFPMFLKVARPDDGQKKKKKKTKKKQKAKKAGMTQAPHLSECHPDYLPTLAQ
jgi:hypothetical protein